MNKIALVPIVLLLFFSCSNRKNNAQMEYEKSLPPLIETSAKPFISSISGKLEEISGLMIWNKLYWGFNDSGGQPELLGFTETGQVKMTLEIENATNRDWEAIAQDTAYIYVGDFGNNFGNREDLCIYKIKKSAIKSTENQKVNASKIQVNYLAQKEFSYPLNSNPFDCEALLEFNGSLYMFSKNWQNYSTEVYRLPTQNSNYHLNAVDTLNVNLLVTGADLSPDGSKLALAGYLNYKTFLWIFSDFKGDDFNSGSSTFFHLKNIDGAQTEGVYFLNNDTVLISAEKTDLFTAQVFLVNINEDANGAHQDK